MTERWSVFMDDFLVSSDGRVRSLDRTVYSAIPQHNGSRIVRGKEKSLQLHKKTGYVMVHAKGKLLLLHRLVAKAFIPNPQELPEVNHKDGNKQNNRVDNLEWITRHQNARHAHNNGFYDNARKLSSERNRGAGSHLARMNETSVKEIRQFRADGFSCAWIANRYGITASNVSAIVNRKTWKHI